MSYQVFSNIFPWNGWFYNHHTPICGEKSPILRNKRGSSMIFTGFFQTLTLSSAPFWLGGIRGHPFLESHGDSHARWECPGLAGQSHHLPRSNWYQLFWWLRCSSFTILGKAYPENLEFYPIATIGSILLGCASKCTGCCGYPKDAAFVFVKRVLQAPQIPIFIKSMGISGS